jgi:hypothetical protein
MSTEVCNYTSDPARLVKLTYRVEWQMSTMGIDRHELCRRLRPGSMLREQCSTQDNIHWRTCGTVADTKLFFDVCHSKHVLDCKSDLVRFIPLAICAQHTWSDDFSQLGDMWETVNGREALKFACFFDRYDDRAMFEDAMIRLVQVADEMEKEDYSVLGEWYDYRGVIKELVSRLCKANEEKDEELEEARRENCELEQRLDDAMADMGNMQEQIDNNNKRAQ